VTPVKHLRFRNVTRALVEELGEMLKRHGAKMSWQSSGPHAVNGQVTHQMGEIDYLYLETEQTLEIWIRRTGFAPRLMVGGIRQAIEEAGEQHGLSVRYATA
jgi:hypothetical protein